MCDIEALKMEMPIMAARRAARSKRSISLSVRRSGGAILLFVIES